MSAIKCRKCGRTTIECPTCRGGRNRGLFGATLLCRACNNTGRQCPAHQGHWS